MLTRLGYTALTASNGEEAIRMIKEITPDLVLLEMIMESGIDGLETYKRISEMSPGIKAVLTGRYTEMEVLAQAEEIGITQFLKKPFTMEKLGRAVKKEMERT